MLSINPEKQFMESNLMLWFLLSFILRFIHEKASSFLVRCLSNSTTIPRKLIRVLLFVSTTNPSDILYACRVEADIGSGDDSGMNGVRNRCSDGSTQLTSNEGPWGYFSSDYPAYCQDGFIAAQWRVS